MRARFTAALLAAMGAALIIVAGAGATMVGIYRDGMETPAQREQLVKLAGRNCTRGSAEQTLLITLGKLTSQCSFRTPVLGRDLEVAASESLLSATPKSLQRTVYLSLILRTGGGAGYQLVVYPAQQKVQLRKNLPGGKVKYLAIARSQPSVQGINRDQPARPPGDQHHQRSRTGQLSALCLRGRQAGRRSCRSGRPRTERQRLGRRGRLGEQRHRRGRQRRQRHCPGAEPVLSAVIRGAGLAGASASAGLRRM